MHVDSGNKATIIAGVLGLIGGLVGAFGAYYSARISIENESKKHISEIKRADLKEKINVLIDLNNHIRYVKNNSEDVRTSIIRDVHKNYSELSNKEDILNTCTIINEYLIKLNNLVVKYEVVTKLLDSKADTEDIKNSYLNYKINAEVLIRIINSSIIPREKGEDILTISEIFNKSEEFFESAINEKINVTLYEIQKI